MIIKNAIQCNICGEEIESKHRHHFVWCSCMSKDENKGCAVDGGRDYLRRLGTNFTEKSQEDTG